MLHSQIVAQTLTCPKQVLKGEAYDGKAVDVWSCGCSLYILLCGDYP